MDHGLPRGFWWQQRLWTSTQKPFEKTIQKMNHPQSQIRCCSESGKSCVRGQDLPELRPAVHHYALGTGYHAAIPATQLYLKPKSSPKALSSPPPSGVNGGSSSSATMDPEVTLALQAATGWGGLLVAGASQEPRSSTASPGHDPSSTAASLPYLFCKY